MRAYEVYADDLSNWYIRRSRRRFWAGSDEAAFQTLWYALVQALRAMAPILPFVTDDLWRNLVPDGPASVHLAGWPDVAEPDRALLDEIEDVRRVVTLAHQARATSGLRIRQPLRSLVVEGAPTAGTPGDRGRGQRQRGRGRHRQAELRVKPNLPALGPRLGKELRAVQEALQAEEFEQLPGGRFRAAGHELDPDDVIVERPGREAPQSRRRTASPSRSTRRSTTSSCSRGVCDLVRQVNTMRKEQGLALTDRIVLTTSSRQRAAAALGVPQLLNLREPATAALRYNDVVAIGLVRALTEAGVLVGRDFAVIGFDDIEEAKFTLPALSSVAVNGRNLGSRAAQALDVNSQQAILTRRRSEPTSSVVRASCGASTKKMEARA